MSTRVLKYSLVLALSAASVAGAQAKTPPAGPPVTTNGAARANAHASGGQAHAAAARNEARLNKAERTEVDQAESDSRAALKGVKLDKAERSKVAAIVKNYNTQRKALVKAAADARKAGTPDADFVTKLHALRDQERAEIRAALPATAQTRFDANVAKRDKPTS
ncbi:MAG TPA: hypothetical protein VJ867_02695 [Gemmatimonadaceae bacterium]|nr:hypothetical protein [Gemmatimonadaceae bacterium]